MTTQRELHRLDIMNMPSEKFVFHLEERTDFIVENSPELKQGCLQKNSLYNPFHTICNIKYIICKSLQ